MKAKRIISLAAALMSLLFFTPQARAQYWEAANQLTNVISPILSGSGAYKGSIEIMGVAGVGNDKLNHVEFSTSQGYQYNQWFYMGAGLGVDIVRSSYTDVDNVYRPESGEWGPSRPSRFGQKRTGVMIPVFSDFRLTIPTGNSSSPSVFIDLRLGASWLVGNNYLRTQDNWLRTNTQFYLRPSIGVRIPTNARNARQAVNIGVSYLLLTSNNSSWAYDNPSFSSVGASISYEW